MPQRFLKPGITTSEKWNSLTWFGQSFYIRIMTLVDDAGRYDARIPILHAYCFPLRDDVDRQQVAAERSRLQEAGLIQVYCIGDKEFLQVTNWSERVRNASKWPDPSAADGSRQQPMAADGKKKTLPSPSPSPSPLDHSANAESVVFELAQESQPAPTPDSFSLFWEAYPRKVAKKKASEAWKKGNCSALLPQILKAIEQQKAGKAWKKDGGQFIPHPASWLNAERWNDAPPPEERTF